MENTLEYNYKPMGDQVVVKILKNKEEKTSGGLLKPSGTDDTMLGVVIIAGEGIYTHQGTLIPTKVKPNDLVLLQGTGVKHKNGKETYQIYREQSILSILKKV